MMVTTGLSISGLMVLLSYLWETGTFPSRQSFVRLSTCLSCRPLWCHLCRLDCFVWLWTSGTTGRPLATTSSIALMVSLCRLLWPVGARSWTTSLRPSRLFPRGCILIHWYCLIRKCYRLQRLCRVGIHWCHHAPWPSSIAGIGFFLYYMLNWDFGSLICCMWVLRSWLPIPLRNGRTPFTVHRRIRWSLCTRMTTCGGMLRCCSVSVFLPMMRKVRSIAPGDCWWGLWYVNLVCNRCVELMVTIAYVLSMVLSLMSMKLRWSAAFVSCWMIPIANNAAIETVTVDDTVSLQSVECEANLTMVPVRLSAPWKELAYCLILLRWTGASLS